MACMPQVAAWPSAERGMGVAAPVTEVVPPKPLHSGDAPALGMATVLGLGVGFLAISAAGLPFRPAFLLAPVLDTCIAVYLTACLMLLQRRNLSGAILPLMIVIGALTYSSFKLAVFGVPGFFADATQIPKLVRDHDASHTLAAAFLIALGIVYLLNARFTRARHAIIALLPLALFAGAAALVDAVPSLRPQVAALLPAPVVGAPPFGHFLNAYADLVAGSPSRAYR